MQDGGLYLSLAGDIRPFSYEERTSTLNNLLDNRADPTEIAGMVKQIMASNAQVMTQNQALFEQSAKQLQLLETQQAQIVAM